MNLRNILDIAASGMRAESTRMRVISENIANTDSTAQVPGGAPYRRKVVTFHNFLDRALGIEKVAVRRIGVDQSAFNRRYDPGHPAADKTGYVLTPNVNGMIEMADMREAQRSYEANLSMITVAKDMLRRTIALLE